MSFDRTAQGEFSFVYYDTLFQDYNSGETKQVGYDAKAYLEAILDGLPSRTDSESMQYVANMLMAEAQRLYKEEVQALSSFFGISPAQLDYTEADALTLYKDIISSLNVALQAKDALKHAIDLLDKDEANGTNIAKGHATSAAKLIADRFDSKLRAKVDALSDKGEIFQNDNFEALRRKCEIIGEECMREAFEATAEDAADVAPDGKIIHAWENLYNLSMNSTAKDAIVSSLLKAFNIDNLAKQLMEINKTPKSGGKGKGKGKNKQGKTSGALKININALGGHIEERLSAVIPSLMNSGSNGNWTIKSTQAMKGAGANIDVTHVLIKFGVDTTQIETILKSIGDYDIQVGDKDKKKTARQGFNSAYNQFTKFGNGEIAIIQETTKAYSLTDGHFGKKGDGFSGTTYKYESLSSLLGELAITSGKADNLLKALINLQKGTVIGDRAATGKDQIKLALTQIFADLMFERPSLQVPNSPGIVYVFRLSNALVPLSYVLRMAAQAARSTYADLTRVMSFTISNKAPLKYYDRSQYGEGSGLKGGEHAQRMRWEEQQEISRNAVGVSVHFLSDFLSLLNGDLRNYV